SRFGDDANCRKLHAQRCTANLEYEGVGATPESTKACAEAITSCAAIRVPPPSCATQGTKTRGTPCTVSAQCANGGFCSNDCVCMDGVPLPTKNEGESCTQPTECGYGLSCRAGVCQHGLPEGAVCMLPSPDRCDEALECTSGTCQKSVLLEIGQPCRGFIDLCRGGGCISGTCRPYVGAGEKCGNDGLCLDPFVCSNGICVKRTGC
ncbi:MAG: hypothetical protein ACXWUG_03250, partial [Polyangiales bacterium]